MGGCIAIEVMRRSPSTDIRPWQATVLSAPAVVPDPKVFRSAAASCFIRELHQGGLAIHAHTGKDVQQPAAQARARIAAAEVRQSAARIVLSSCKLFANTAVCREIRSSRTRTRRTRSCGTAACALGALGLRSLCFNHFALSLSRWGWEFLKTMDDICGALPVPAFSSFILALNTANVSSFNWPFLVVHGEKDPLCAVAVRSRHLRIGFIRLPAQQGSRLLYEKAASRDKTLKTYPNCLHEIFNELNRDEVNRRFSICSNAALVMNCR